MSRNGRAFAAACVGIALFAAMDVAMKGLAIALGAYSAMLWRTVAGMGVAGVPWALSRPAWPQASMLRLHLLRGGITAAMAVSFFWGLARTPLAQAIALTFIAPILAIFLAVALLGERIARGAVLGSAVAFAGVLTILASRAGDDPAGDDWRGALAILFSAVCYAYNLILQRRQAQAARPAEVAFFQSLTMCGFLTLAAPFVWPASPAGHWPAILLSATLATVSLHLLAWAYARAEASALAPVEYTAFLWAALLGWAVFGEAVGLGTLAGAALIVGGCALAMRRRPELATAEVGL